MADKPEPTAWGALISAARKRAGLSAREAARRAGISEGRWRQITGGYQVVSPGVYAHVRGPATTLATMAAVAGVTPAELTAVGRDDAALELVRRQELTPEQEMLARVRSLGRDQARDLLATIAWRLGIGVPDDGHRSFGT